MLNDLVDVVLLVANMMKAYTVYKINNTFISMLLMMFCINKISF